MNPIDIVSNIKKLFGEAASPGQAFDAILAMRRDGVTWDDAYKAIVTRGNAQRVLNRIRLDESDEGEAWECPGCGISRTTKDHCINPHCPEHRPNPQTTRIEAERPEPKFKNPKPTFGKYQDKTLLEIAAINPGYLKWMSTEHGTEFWREQAKLAMLKASVEAPPSRDTDATGYF